MLSNRERKELLHLRDRKGRQALGRFVAEGVRLVEDLAASPLTLRWAAASSPLEDTPRGAALLRALHAREIPVHRIPEAEFAAISGTEAPQGVLAVADVPRFRLENLRLGGGRAVLLALDAVQDPGNFGTLTRTAEAFGASGVIALPGTVDPWNPKCVRAAMGSSFRLPIIETAWDLLEPALREHAYTILAADAGGAAIPRPAPPRALLVLGNEGGGISARARARADRIVGIPLRGRAESLNVAAAGAILLHELLR